MQSTAWSKYLATYNIADDLRAHAYEATTAKQRACLKNAIAFHALEGEGPSCEIIKRSHESMGYEQTIQNKPAPWTLYICDENYSSPARFIAALMPAINMQVANIFVLFMNEKPVQSLLTCLELLGIEECLAMPKQDAMKVVQELLQDLANERGRVLILSDNGQNLSEIYQYINALPIPLWQEMGQLKIYATKQADMGLLQFAHANAELCDELKVNVRAVYGYTEHIHLKSAFTTQAWAKGMEACFVHANLSKDFFKNITLVGANLESKVL